MYKICVQNCFAKHETNYKCYLCRKQLLSNDEKAILEHVNDAYHKELFDLIAWDKVKESKFMTKIASFSEAEYEELVENNISFKPKSFYCNYCMCKLSTPFQHLRAKPHKRRFEAHINKQNTNNTNGKENIELNKDEATKLSDQQGTSYIQSKKISLTFEFQQLKENCIKFKKKTKFRCKACKLSICGINQTYEHITESLHKINLKKFKERFTNKNNTTYTIDTPIKGKYYYCAKCKVYLTLNEILIHCHCLLHLYEEQPELNFDIIKFNFDDNKKVTVKCLLCDQMMDSDKTLAKHINMPEHNKRLDVLIYVINIDESDNSDNSTPEIMNDVDQLNYYIFNPTIDIRTKDFCTICYEPIGLEEKSYIQKFELQQKMLQELQTHQHEQTQVNVLDKFTTFYKCFLCNRSCTSISSLFKHYNRESTHKKRLNKFYKILNNKDSNYSKLLQSCDLTEQLFEKTKDELNKKFKKERLQKQQLKQELKRERRQNRKLPYNKDILDFGDKYVFMCLESGNENIYSIDSDQIRLFQLGVSLMVALKSSEFCIPCQYEVPQNLYSLYDHLQHEVHIQNLRDMEESHKEYKKYQDQFSDLDLAKTCMQQESEECIKCFVCDTTLQNSDSDIEIHIKSAIHISKIKYWREDREAINYIFSAFFKDSWYYADKFCCKVCNLTFNREISFAKHLEQLDHLKKIELDKAENKINICHSCLYCWYGKSDYSKHYDDFSHVSLKRKKSNSMLPKMKPAVTSLLHSIDKKVKNLVHESDKVTLMQQDKEQQLLESVERTVKPVYPLAKAYVFGSRSSGLGFATSDVDVFLDCENIYYNIGSKEESQKYIRVVTNQFLKVNKDVWKKDRILLQPRVPIIKLEHKITGLKCDISFISGLGVEKSKLIRNYVIAYQYCRKLILYLKKWFAVCDLYGPQAVNAYAISWYTIFYLQIKGILPSVYQLIELQNKSKYVDGWQCGFSKTVPVIPVNNTFQDLLQGFFSYYAEFDYQADAVCPLLGKVLKKSTFVNIDKLPEGMEIYKNRMKIEELEFFRYDSPMCIQDPVDLSQNITKAITKIQLRCFRSYCAESLKELLRTRQVEQAKCHVRI